MKGERIYYTDAYSTHFTAVIVEIVSVGGSPAVILDRSLFYPESGGQPHDTGTINGISVTNVTVRDSDQAVIHSLEEDPSEDSVHGEINWARRFDHMQQHSGQHLLSRVLLNLLDADTLSFHLGDHESTIDVDVDNMDDRNIIEVENLTNQIIWENRPVYVQFLKKDEVKIQGIRSAPDLDEDPIRIVSIYYPGCF